MPQERPRTKIYRKEGGEYKFGIDVPDSVAIGLGLQEESEVFWSVNEKDRYAIFLPVELKMSGQEMAVYNGIVTLGVGCNSGQIYQEYSRLAQERDMPKLTSRRMTTLMAKLDERGLITTAIKSSGRYGRTKIVTHIAKQH